LKHKRAKWTFPELLKSKHSSLPVNSTFHIHTKQMTHNTAVLTDLYRLSSVAG